MNCKLTFFIIIQSNRKDTVKIYAETVIESVFDSDITI